MSALSLCALLFPSLPPVFYTSFRAMPSRPARRDRCLSYASGGSSSPAGRRGPCPSHVGVSHDTSSIPYRARAMMCTHNIRLFLSDRTRARVLPSPFRPHQASRARTLSLRSAPDTAAPFTDLRISVLAAAEAFSAVTLRPSLPLRELPPCDAFLVYVSQGSGVPRTLTQHRSFHCQAVHSAPAGVRVPRVRAAPPLAQPTLRGVHRPRHRARVQVAVCPRCARSQNGAPEEYMCRRGRQVVCSCFDFVCFVSRRALVAPLYPLSATLTPALSFPLSSCSDLVYP